MSALNIALSVSLWPELMTCFDGILDKEIPILRATIQPAKRSGQVTDLAHKLGIVQPGHDVMSTGRPKLTRALRGGLGDGR